MKIFEHEFKKKKIHTKIKIVDKILDFIHIQKKRQISFMRQLSKTERHYDQKLIFVIKYQWIAKQIAKNQNLHQNKFAKNIQSDLHKKKHEWMTTFKTRYKLYKYTIMSFEFTNVSATYQKLINNAFKKYLNIFVIAYFDDILIYSQNEEEHIRHVHAVFKNLNEWNLLTKSEKCVFHVFEINFLKFLINKNNIKMNLNKTTAVKNWKRSINVIEVLTFLNFTNYNQRFIKRYLHKTLSLTRLTQKELSWNWNEKTERTFQKFKQACLKTSVLKIFDFKKFIKIKTNVLNMIIKTCLCQKYDDKWHSVIYFSKKLTSAEQNYEIHDKKLLAIVTFLKTLKIYAKETSEFIILMNYKNFVFFIITKKLNQKQIKWLKKFAQYRFKIRYTSNKNNVRTDALNK